MKAYVRGGIRLALLGALAAAVVAGTAAPAAAHHHDTKVIIVTPSPVVTAPRILHVPRAYHHHYTRPSVYALAYAPGYVPGYRTYTWVPRVYTTWVWVQPHYTAGGRWVEGHWEQRVVDHGYYQQVWVSPRPQW